MISEPSGNRWQLGCSRYGATCLQNVAALPGVRAMTLDSLQSWVDARGRLDVIGIFETLDHVRRPVELIRRIEPLTRCLVLVQHHARHANRQHGFGFMPEFESFLVRDLGVTSVVDLSISLGGGVSFVWILSFAS